ncbi:uncharacterized [Tachysurus ichikawai]
MFQFSILSTDSLPHLMLILPSSSSLASGESQGKIKQQTAYSSSGPRSSVPQHSASRCIGHPESSSISPAYSFPNRLGLQYWSLVLLVGANADDLRPLWVRPVQMAQSQSGLVGRVGRVKTPAMTEGQRAASPPGSAGGRHFRCLLPVGAN